MPIHRCFWSANWLRRREWNVKSIKKRRRRLFEWAMARWDVDFGELEEVEAAIAGGELTDDQGDADDSAFGTDE